MKVYVVKQPEGAYDSYTETVVKVFIDKSKAVKYVKEENCKKPFKQSKKCEDCDFKWCIGDRLYKSKPSCFVSYDGKYCNDYFEKYRDVQQIFFKEYDVEDFADYTKQDLLKKVEG